MKSHLACRPGAQWGSQGSEWTRAQPSPPPEPLRTESSPWLRWDLWFPEPQGLLLIAGQGLVPPYRFPLLWDTFSLFLDLVPEEPEKKPWADSQEARPGPSPGWLGCLESLESESGELILSLSLAKRGRVTSTEVWLPAPLRGQSCEEDWALGNDPVAMPGAPPHLQREPDLQVGTRPKHILTWFQGTRLSGLTSGQE